MANIPGFSATAPSVFETEADPAVVDRRCIDELIVAARTQANGRARLLLHPDRGDGLHEMVIALPSDSLDHPHINFRSGKSFMALSGQFAVVCFSDDGQQRTVFVLSAPPFPGATMIRLRRPTWHTIVPLQGDTVFLETILGPFTGNHLAPWFPERGSPGYAMAERELRDLCTARAPALDAP